MDFAIIQPVNYLRISHLQKNFHTRFNNPVNGGNPKRKNGQGDSTDETSLFLVNNR
jgi:hypothetical protein